MKLHRESPELRLDLRLSGRLRNAEDFVRVIADPQRRQRRGRDVPAAAR
jgi:hypothetical protein